MIRTRLLPLILGAAALACFDDPVTNATTTTSEETGDGDGDASGDGDGDPATGDGDGDMSGDGDGDMSGDGDGDMSGDGDGDMSGDGDGDMSGDGDGDMPGDEILLDFGTELCDFGDEAVISYDPGGQEVTFLDCPSPDKTSPLGGVLAEDNPTLDGGQNYPGPQLLMYPPENANPIAHVSLQFEYVSIEPGDRLQFNAGCGAGKQTCSATIQVNWFDGNNQNNALIFNQPEMTDGQTFDVDMPLDEIAGQNVSFSLVVLVDPGIGDDGIYFANGRVIRPAQP